MPVNPPKFDMIEDMSNLTYLNDATVLWNMKERFANKLIYVSTTCTETGPAYGCHMVDTAWYIVDPFPYWNKLRRWGQFTIPSRLQTRHLLSQYAKLCIFQLPLIFHRLTRAFSVLPLIPTVDFLFTLLEWLRCIEAKDELKCLRMYSRCLTVLTLTCSTVRNILSTTFLF